MGRRLSRIAVLGATALVLGLIAAPGAFAQEAVTCLDLATFTEEPATIVGTNGNDVLRGTAGRDVIAGLAGTTSSPASAATTVSGARAAAT